MESKIIEYVISQRGFLIKIILHRYNVEQTKVLSVFFDHFYYSQIIRTFNRNYKNDYDVRTSGIIHPITFQKLTKRPIKVF